MSKIGKAVYGIHQLDALAGQRQKTEGRHPLSGLLVTIAYIMTVVSFPKYDVIGLAGMVLYLIILFIVQDIPLRQCISQLRTVLLLVGVVGLANPFFDRTVLGSVGDLVITGGMVSMVTLMMKGVFSVLASYLLIATTGMEQICYALRVLHFPRGFVTVLLLIYRYIIVLLKEVERMTDAYSLRSPGQKGIHIKVWGTFLGLLLLRSMDRAEVVYESMMLRGYDGEFRGSGYKGNPVKSVLFFLIWTGAFLILRYLPVFQMAGNLMM